MTSREALERIKKIEILNAIDKWGCHETIYFEEAFDFESEKGVDELLKIIEKDLEVLEALKRNLCLVENCIDFYVDEDKNINAKTDTNDYQIVLAYLIDATCPLCLSKNVKVKYAKALENRRLYYCFCDDCHKDFGSVRGIKNDK